MRRIFRPNARVKESAPAAVRFAVLPVVFGAERLDFSGGEQRGGGLPFRFLARTERDRDAVRQAHQHAVTSRRIFTH